MATVARDQKQPLRDNARTLLGQINEQRQPFTRADAEAIRSPTIFIGGANAPGALPVVLRALAAHVPDARTVIMPGTTHFMFGQAPQGFCARSWISWQRPDYRTGSTAMISSTRSGIGRVPSTCRTWQVSVSSHFK